MEYNIEKNTKRKTKGLKNLFSIFAISGLVIFTFFTGFYFGEESVFCEICQPSQINFSLFWETFQKLKERYVEPGKINEKDIIYGAISGMVGSLDDPYTIFMKPDDTDKFLEDISGRFEGVGMEIGIRNSTLQVIAPLEGTPADRAGLRAGDKILKVSDVSTSEITIDQAVSMIRGEKGTAALLTIFRDGWDMPKDIEIIRDTIEVPSLKWEMLDNDIAYIKIYQFSEKTGFDFIKIATQVLGSNAKKIVLDLRNNPGGYLEIAVDIAGFFLERGEVVVIEDSINDKVEYLAETNPVLLNYPVVILINQGSASASEILAGALRDNRGISLIGEDSFGKGSVQQLENLSDGSSLKVTVAKWLTPNGDTINGIGLEPDIKIEFTEQDYENGLDPQLEKALEILSELE